MEPLNLIPYDIADTKTKLQTELGWKDYGKKHYESRFTKFFQSYYLLPALAMTSESRTFPALLRPAR